MAKVHPRREKLDVLNTKEEILSKIQKRKPGGKFSTVLTRYSISALVSDTHHHSQSIEKLLSECEKRKVIRTVEEGELNEMELSSLSTRGRPPVSRYDITARGTQILNFLLGSPSADDGKQFRVIARTVQALRALDISRRSSET